MRISTIQWYIYIYTKYDDDGSDIFFSYYEKSSFFIYKGI